MNYPARPTRKTSAFPNHPGAEIPDDGQPNLSSLTTGYFKVNAPYRTLRRNGTRDWLLTYTLSGHGFYRQEKVELEARPGDLILLEPYSFHYYGSFADTHWEVLWAHFIPRPAWLAHLRWPAPGRGLYRIPIARPTARRAIRNAFFRVHQAEDALEKRLPRAAQIPGLRSKLHQGGIATELAMNALEEVLLRAARELELDASQTQPGVRGISMEIRTVLDHLTSNLDQPQCIEALARLAGLSPSRFAHRFKEETGDAVISFLLKLRLRQAARLLEFSGRSVKEAARETGFECPFYFSRQFRKHFSQSPREFKMRKPPRKL